MAQGSSGQLEIVLPKTQSVSLDISVWQCQGPTKGSQALASHFDTISEWKEIAHGLALESYQFAQEFVNLCEYYSAFYWEPGCSVDRLEDGSVMFDWNTGELPIFTAVITPGQPPMIAYVGKFMSGKVSGEEKTLETVELLLFRFVRDSGIPVWQNISQGLWSREVNLNWVGALRSTHPHLTGIYQYSAPLMLREAT